MNTPTRLSVALAGALFSTLALAAPPLELKGLALGKPVDCKRLETIGGTCDWSTGHAMAWDTTLAGQPAQILIQTDDDKRTTRISSSQFDFDAVRAALAGRWGEPKCGNDPVMNGFGAHFTRTVCTWPQDDQGNVLMIGRNVGKLGDQRLVLEPDHSAAAAQERAKAASDI